MKSYYSGFTLIEMAIVLAIIGLLLGGLLMPLSTQVESNKRTETKKMMTEIKEALIGYSLVNRYLPCPDTDNPPNGKENRAGTICAGAANRSGVAPNFIWHGVLPWVDLGVEEADSWATRYKYAVMETFSDNGTLFTLTTTGNIRVQDGNDIIINAPAIIVSHGKNRFNGINLTGNNQPNSPSSDERENSSYGPPGPPNHDRDFISRTYSTATANTQFDDIVLWISPNILFNRLVSAGQLP